jgi:hypothetical protein
MLPDHTDQHDNLRNLRNLRILPFSLLMLATLIGAGWLWFLSSRLITEWVLGTPAIQQLVIALIADLQASGSLTLLLLGTLYVLASLVELVAWPAGRMRPLALIVWIPTALADSMAVFNGYAGHYAGLLAGWGLPAPAWGLWLSGLLIGPILALGPEAGLRLGLPALYRALWRQA